MPTFVSHSAEDKAIYSALCFSLDAAGVSRWDPATMSPSNSLAEQLRDAIRKCNLCIFLVTRQSVVSRWCLAEAGAFWGAGKKVFLFMGESGLSDDELPPQFKGGLWTSDTRVLLDAVRDEPEGASTSPVFEHPANAFWLASDLARAIRSGMFEPQDRDTLKKKIRQAIHHLNECGLQVPYARHLLLECLKNAQSNPLSNEQCKELVNSLAIAKNEIGGAIERLQTTFRGYPTMAQTIALDQQLEHLKLV